MSETQYSTEQLQKMTRAMAEDLRAMKAELDAERAAKQAAESSLTERGESLKALESQMERVNAERREQYGELLDKDVVPYLHQLKETLGGKDPKLERSIETMEAGLRSGLENAYADTNAEAGLRVLHAVASANKMNSSTLDGLIKSEHEWGVNYEKLLKEKTALQEEMSATAEASAAKDKALEALRAEMDAMRAKSSEAVSNAESHFESPPVVVAATASSEEASAGFDSIFDYKPRYNWRTAYPDPGPALQSGI